eukprot:GHVU01081766.1.p1 GENE.GHVU01081766.1~~GHVU01081766.1.p1  ORF type:complete len:108 (-),score=1.46 GHVU01081766.1:405-728(-)
MNHFVPAVGDTCRKRKSRLRLPIPYQCCVQSAAAYVYACILASTAIMCRLRMQGWRTELLIHRTRRWTMATADSVTVFTAATTTTTRLTTALSPTSLAHPPFGRIRD